MIYFYCGTLDKDYNKQQIKYVMLNDDIYGKTGSIVMTKNLDFEFF